MLGGGRRFWGARGLGGDGRGSGFCCRGWGGVGIPDAGLGGEGDLGGQGIPGAVGRLNQAEENQPCDQAVYDFPFSGHVKHHPFFKWKIENGRWKMMEQTALRWFAFQEYPRFQFSVGFIVTSFPFFCLNVCFSPLFRP